MKALVGTFNQEKALVGAVVEANEALHSTNKDVVVIRQAAAHNTSVWM